MQRLPVELLDAIFDLCDDDISIGAKRELRTCCRSFCQSLTPRVFGTVRLADFSRDAFDRLLALSQSHLAGHVTTFEYKVVRHLGPGIAANPTSSLCPTHSLTLPLLQEMFTVWIVS